MPKSNKPHDEPGKKRRREGRADAPGAAVALSCDDVLDRLDLYLDTLDGSDGTDEGLPGMTGGDRVAVETHVTRCPACAQELSRARRIRDGLRALPEVPYAPKTPAETGAPARILTGPWLRWAVPLAAAAVLALALLTLLPERTAGPASTATVAVETPSPEDGFPEGVSSEDAATEISPQELARAELEARYALARLAEATRRARREIRDDVLTRHVVAPVQRELLRSFQAPPEIDPAIDPEAAGRRPASL